MGTEMEKSLQWWHVNGAGGSAIYDEDNEAVAYAQSWELAARIVQDHNNALHWQRMENESHV